MSTSQRLFLIFFLFVDIQKSTSFSDTFTIHKKGMEIILITRKENTEKIFHFSHTQHTLARKILQKSLSHYYRNEKISMIIDLLSITLL